MIARARKISRAECFQKDLPLIQITTPWQVELPWRFRLAIQGSNFCKALTVILTGRSTGIAGGLSFGVVRVDTPQVDAALLYKSILPGG